MCAAPEHAPLPLPGAGGAGTAAQIAVAAAIEDAPPPSRAGAGPGSCNGHTRWPHVDLVALLREFGCTLREKKPGKFVSDHPWKHGSRTGECLVVWAAQGRWHCSSCGLGGDAAAAVADYQGCSYADACRWLEARFGPAPYPDRTTAGTSKPPSQATQLLQLAATVYELYQSSAGEPFAVRRDGPPVALPLRGGRASLRAELAHRYAQQTHRAPSAAALSDVLAVLEGQALTAPRRELSLRLARWGDAVVLDLGRADGLAVIIRPGRWEVAPTPSGIIWQRTKLTGELPVPTPAGHGGGGLAGLHDLRNLVNLTDEAWCLFVGSLVAGCFPDIPHPVELLRGPEGAGKSTVAWVRTQLVDPSPVPLRAPPKSLDDWQVAAAGSWVVAVDNVSGISDWLSDALCRAATGDGLVKRELYSDAALAVLAFRRVVVLTMIDAGALRGDLADRVVWYELERIPDTARRLWEDVTTALARNHARWLGALCDLVAAVLATLPRVRLAAYPRMADFAKVLAALDAVAGTHALPAYLAQRGHLAREVVEADTVAAAVEAFAREHGSWTGTASELYDALTPEHPPRGWPADAARLSSRLRKTVEALRRVGVTVAFASHHGRRRLITISATDEPEPEPDPEPDDPQKKRVGTLASPASPASPSDSPVAPNGDTSGVHGDASGVGWDARWDARLGLGDAGDAVFPVLSDDICACPGCSHTIDAFSADGRGYCAVHQPSDPDPGAGVAPSPGDGAGVITVGPAAPQVELITDAAALQAVLPTLLAQPALGLDTETTGLDPHTGRLRLVQLATPERVYILDAFRVDPLALRPLLAEGADGTGGPVLVGHNLKFDLRFLWTVGLPPPPGRRLRLFDTMLVDQVLRGSGVPRALAELAQETLGASLEKAFQQADWSGALSPAMLAYAARDAAVLLPLADRLRERVAQQDLAQVADLEHRALPAVAWLEQVGCPFDLAGWEALAEAAQAARERLARELSALVGAAVNWDSAPQVLAALRVVGLSLPDTREETLCRYSDHQLVALLLRYREASKRAGTYGRDWFERCSPATGRVHPNWHQIGTDSGRMSCSRPNLQNLPRDPRYRACLRPGAERVFVKADYAQIELRIAAELAGEGRMIDAFRRGEDLHALTARLVLGKETVTKEDRQAAKALNFGLIYGMGAETLHRHAASGYGVTLTAAEAERFREAFFAAYPGLRRWHRAQPHGPITTHTRLGRKRFGVERFTEKLNTPVQGTGADGLKAALALLWETRERCPSAVPVLAVHDEIVVECDAAAVETAKAWLTDCMQRGMAQVLRQVPVVVEATVCRDYAGTALPVP